MNKNEFITAIAEKSGFTKKDCEAIVNVTLLSIQETLKSGEKIQLIGFGTFELRDRKARMGRNPQKPGEQIQISACKIPVFKAGKRLKEAMK